MHDLIANLYAAAAADGDDAWHEVARELRERLQAHSVVIDDGTMSGSAHHLLVNRGFDSDLVLRHFEEFSTIDSNIGVRSLFTGPVGTPFDIHRGIDAETWRRDGSVSAILTPQGITEGALLVLERTEERLSSLLVYRDEHAGSLQSSETLFLEALAPHLKNAFAVRRRLKEMAEQERQSHLLLAEVSAGHLVTDRRGRVKRATGLAARALADETLIYCSHAQIRARDGSADKVLRGRFHAPDNPPLGCPLPVAGDGYGRIVLRELPVAAARAISQDGDCVFLVNLERPDTPDPAAMLRCAFGLTETEAEVAIELSKGLSAAEIAEKRGNAVLTIRTHIKSILLKTGARRQAELVFLLCSRIGAG